MFFDALGIRYEYEPEGFELSDGTRYLPDFYLPEINGGTYVEVKGQMSEKDYRKVKAFWKEGDRPLYVLGGLPTQAELDRGDIYGYVDKYPDCFGYGIESYGWDWPYLFCVCPACGKVGLEFDGRGWRVCGDHADIDLAAETYRDKDGITRRFKHPEVKGWRSDDKGYSWNQSKLVSAYNIARQARFEHGEKPRPFDK